MLSKLHLGLIVIGGLVGSITVTNILTVATMIFYGAVILVGIILSMHILFVFYGNYRRLNA